MIPIDALTALNLLLKSDLPCKKLCSLMLPYSGASVDTLYDTRGFELPRVDHSTQKTLDEGVEKMREIYSSYDQVGIKDRSMIWNS